MNKTYLLLGSNLGNSRHQLQDAIKHIESKIGKVLRSSAIYKTAAWGKTDQPDFLNQVIILTSKLNAKETMKTILSIEEIMGRKRTEKNAPRSIDIDILFYDNEKLETEFLTIPHPLIQNRRFVLTPLNELTPDFVHPILHKTIQQLLAECPDKLDVKKI